MHTQPAAPLRNRAQQKNAPIGRAHVRVIRAHRRSYTHLLTEPLIRRKEFLRTCVTVRSHTALIILRVLFTGRPSSTRSLSTFPSLVRTDSILHDTLVSTTYKYCFLPLNTSPLYLPCMWACRPAPAQHSRGRKLSGQASHFQRARDKSPDGSMNPQLSCSYAFSRRVFSVHLAAPPIALPGTASYARGLCSLLLCAG